MKRRWAWVVAVSNDLRCIHRKIDDRMYQWSLRHLPAGMVARAMETFIALACAIAGLGIILSISQPPAAEQFLPDNLYLVWAGSLLIGGLALLCGVMSIKWIKPPLVFYISRLACYRLGLRLLLTATLLYAISQVSLGGVNAIPAATFTVFFTVACWARLLTIGRE